MVRASRWLPLALALTVGLGTAAMARAEARQVQGGAAAAQHSAMQQGMLPGGISIKGQLDHAYTEAVKAHEAAVMGMTDMAKNHLANVDLVLVGLESHQAQLGGDLNQRLAAIRQDANQLKGNVGKDLSQQTASLVSRFAGFYDRIAMAPTAGGGGGGLAAHQKTPLELIGSSAGSVAQAQAAAAGKDWEAAQLHIKDAQNHLSQVSRATTAMGLKLDSKQTNDFRTLTQETQQVSRLIEQKSPQAVRQAGVLVTAMGVFMPRVASTLTGGGAGTGGQQPKHQNPSQDNQQ